MSSQSIFSSYRGGENRVTATMLAVLGRIGLGLTERIIATAVEDPSMSLASFSNQPAAGGAGVPDGEIRASFRYLIETKTAVNALRIDQLERHLDRLDGTFADERLLVVTPDSEEPNAVSRVDDPRVVWVAFGQLAHAIESVVQDPNELASEQERFLLRELMVFLGTEGLLSVDDTIVVAARSAYPEYQKIGAYGCQPNRPIRPVSYFAFYTGKQIKPEIARVHKRFHEVLFTPDEVRRRRALKEPLEARLADVIEWRLKTRPSQLDGRFDVYVLSRSGDPETVVLPAPVVHEARGPWTQSQRYTSLESLRKAETTADL